MCDMYSTFSESDEIDMTIPVICVLKSFSRASERFPDDLNSTGYVCSEDDIEIFGISIQETQD